MGEGGEEEHDLMQLKGRTGKKEEKAKRKKITRLLEEYTQFKKKNIRHFRFNGSPNSSNFSKFHSLEGEFTADICLMFVFLLQEKRWQNPPFSWSRSTLPLPPLRIFISLFVHSLSI